MRRTARIGVGAGILAGLAGAAKALAGRRQRGKDSTDSDEKSAPRRRRSARRRGSGLDLWPAVPVKPGAAAVIDAERAGSVAASEDGEPAG